MPDNNDPLALIEDELRHFVARIEEQEAEKREIAALVKQVYAEAKARGYDVAVLRRIVADRRKKADAVQEFESVLEVYREAVGWRS